MKIILVSSLVGICGWELKFPILDGIVLPLELDPLLCEDVENRMVDYPTAPRLSGSEAILLVMEARPSQRIARCAV